MVRTSAADGPSRAQVARFWPTFGQLAWFDDKYGGVFGADSSHYRDAALAPFATMVASSIDGAILVDWLVGRSMDWFLVRAWQNVRILILCLCL